VPIAGSRDPDSGDGRAEAREREGSRPSSTVLAVGVFAMLRAHGGSRSPSSRGGLGAHRRHLVLMLVNADRVAARMGCGTP
jgi:hypothetical protein